MHANFLGIKFSQSWQDLAIWEQFFDENPVKTFIELGTGNGGMSTFFALQCCQRQIVFHTFDHDRYFDFGVGVPALLGMQAAFHHIDLFSEAGTALVIDLIKVSPHPLAIYFDDGNKPREWHTFAPHLWMGDFGIVHDWNTEFFPADLETIPVESLLIPECSARGAGLYSMWFKRVADKAG